jgi:hypothetical protein
MVIFLEIYLVILKILNYIFINYIISFYLEFLDIIWIYLVVSLPSIIFNLVFTLDKADPNLFMTENTLYFFTGLYFIFYFFMIILFYIFFLRFFFKYGFFLGNFIVGKIFGLTDNLYYEYIPERKDKVYYNLEKINDIYGWVYKYYKEVIWYIFKYFLLFQYKILVKNLTKILFFTAIKSILGFFKINSIVVYLILFYFNNINLSYKINEKFYKFFFVKKIIKKNLIIMDYKTLAIFIYNKLIFNLYWASDINLLVLNLFKNLLFKNTILNFIRGYQSLFIIKWMTYNKFLFIDFFTKIYKRKLYYSLINNKFKKFTIKINNLYIYNLKKKFLNKIHNIILLKIFLKNNIKNYYLNFTIFYLNVWYNNYILLKKNKYITLIIENTKLNSILISKTSILILFYKKIFYDKKFFYNRISFFDLNLPLFYLRFLRRLDISLYYRYININKIIVRLPLRLHCKRLFTGSLIMLYKYFKDPTKEFRVISKLLIFFDNNYVLLKIIHNMYLLLKKKSKISSLKFELQVSFNTFVKVLYPYFSITLKYKVLPNHHETKPDPIP